MNISHLKNRYFGIPECKIKFGFNTGPDSKTRKQLIAKKRDGEREEKKNEKEMCENRLDITGH